MKASELRTLSAEEIGKRKKELKEELFNLRFQAASHQIQNPKRIGQIRRNVARIETIAGERKRQSQA